MSAIGRRSFLKGTCAAVAATQLAQLWTPAAAFARQHDGRVLVVLFLRGGLDGLTAVVPHGDPRYHDLRPTIAVPSDRVLDLDGRFGLHPALEPLADLYHQGDLAIVHAAGERSHTRSHFDQMRRVETGTSGADGGSGWLARHLADLGVASAPMHAVAWGRSMPASLGGDTTALSMASLGSFRVRVAGPIQHTLPSALRRLYGGDDALHLRGRAVLDAVDLVAAVNARQDPPRHGASYPATVLGRGLAEIARTVRADVGLTAAAIDAGGWDTHDAMGTPDGGTMARLLHDLGASLRAFADDLGDRLDDVTVVAMSEFGRRVEENGSRGTDHGHGNVMLVLGGGVRGGRVLGDWLGLDDEVLGAHRGDVPVTTDYRDVLGDVLRLRHPGSDLRAVFPGHRVRAVGMG